MKIFISGEITPQNYPQEYPRFKATEYRLTQLGYDVVNPLNHISQYTTRVDAFKTRLMLMMDCGALFQMANWSSQDEARSEFELAVKLSFKILAEGDLQHFEKTLLNTRLYV